MLREQFDKLTELAEQRDKARYAWLRHLLLLASGALTLLVSLKTGSAAKGMFAPLCLRAAWLALGLGILALALALHG